MVLCLVGCIFIAIVIRDSNEVVALKNKKLLENSSGSGQLINICGEGNCYKDDKGKWIPRNIPVLPKLVAINSDAGVGLHIKYEEYEIPNVNWDHDFIGNDDLQYQVREACLAIRKPWYERYPQDPYPKDAPNGILLLGDPGNGKTFIAELIAGHRQYPLFTLTKDVVSSQWVGETTKGLNASFELIKKNAPCVLFVDEIDSFINDRKTSGGNAADNEVRGIVNTFLTQLVELRKYPVFIIAATNHFESLDPAAVREGRFDFKITVKNPDKAARIGLLRKGLKHYVQDVDFNWEQIDKCAERFNGFSVKRILAICERVPVVLAEKGSSAVGHLEVMTALRKIQGSKGFTPENSKSLDEIVLCSKTQLPVSNIINDLKNIQKIEAYGASIARGVIFYGPPGTGKTTIAKTIARESNWAFLSTSGADLVMHKDDLNDIHEKAKSLRPCIIFIDKADDILRSRGHSNYAACTSKLLSIMDGADDLVKDVIFIAATNYPDEVDPALLRVGRFTGKVEFFNPEPSELLALMQMWLDHRIAQVTCDQETQNYVQMLSQGRSQATLFGLLQEALNCAVREPNLHEGRVKITRNHVRAAMQFIDPSPNGRS